MLAKIKCACKIWSIESLTHPHKRVIDQSNYAYKTQSQWLANYYVERCLPLSLNNLQVSLAAAIYGLPYNAVEQYQSRTYIWEMGKSQYTNFNVSISGITRKYNDGRMTGTTYLLKYSAMFWRIPTKHDAQHARHASTAKRSYFNIYPTWSMAGGTHDDHLHLHCSALHSVSASIGPRE